MATVVFNQLITISGLLLLAAQCVFSQTPAAGDSVIQVLLGRDCPVIQLWPDSAAPGEEPGAYRPERIRDTLGNIVRVTDVTDPTITVAAPRGDDITDIGVVIGPGGGYSILAIDLEGTEVAERFNEAGITAFILKYRCPRRRIAPLQDAQRAMAIVKARAAEWGVDSARVGYCGFSAGGHLGAALSANYLNKSYASRDSFDAVSSRPDFAILCYPAYLAGLGSEVTKLDKETAPYFFLHIGGQDANWLPGYKEYAAFLTEKEIEHESHIYEGAQHGYGTRVEPAGPDWPVKAIAMLKERYPAVSISGTGLDINSPLHRNRFYHRGQIYFTFFNTSEPAAGNIPECLYRLNGKYPRSVKMFR